MISLGRVNIAFRDTFFCDEKIISKSSFKGFSRFDSFDDTNGIYSDYPPYPGRKSNDLSYELFKDFLSISIFFFFAKIPLGQHIGQGRTTSVLARYASQIQILTLCD